MREPSVSVQMIIKQSPTSAVTGDDIVAGVVVADNGPLKPTLYTRKSEVLKAFTPSAKILRSTDTTVIHAAAISEMLPVLLARAYDDDGTRGAIAVYNDGTTASCKFKNGNLLTTRMNIILNKQYRSGDEENYVIQVGKTVYYKSGAIFTLPQGSTLTTQEVSLDPNNDNLRSFIKEINKLDKTHYLELVNEGTYHRVDTAADDENAKGKIVLWASNEAELGISPSARSGEVVAEVAPTTDIDYLYTSVEVITANGQEDSSAREATGTLLFYLIAKDPNKSDFTFKLRYPSTNVGLVNKNQLIGIDVYSLTSEYHYEGSLKPDYTNNFQVNQFIENINEYDGIEFEIKVADGIGDYSNQEDSYFYKEIPKDQNASGIPFGGLGDAMITEVTYNDYTNALDNIEEADEYAPSFICALGYCNPDYFAAITAAGSRMFAFVPYGIIDKTKVYDPNTITNGYTKLGEYNSVVMVPHDINTSLADFAVDLSAEVAYLSRYVINKNAGRKFAPIFGKTNGTFSMSKPAVVLQKTIREKLLDLGIMSVVVKRSQGIMYINKNKSYCSDDTQVLTEDQNCRLAYQINRDYKVIMEQFLGEFNTLETRKLATSLLEAYNRDNIGNQIYKPDNIRIQCDEENNPASIIAANKLVVDVYVTYNKAIYEVLIYHSAFDLNNSPDV